MFFLFDCLQDHERHLKRLVCLNGGLNPVDWISICHSESLSSDTGDGRDRENFTSLPFLVEYRLMNTIFRFVDSDTFMVLFTITHL